MTRAASLRRRSASVLVLLVVLIAGTGRAQAQVYSDQQLMELARTTYESAKAGHEDAWMYAAIHINALIQRNPPAVQNSPVFAKQLADGLRHAGEHLTYWYQAYSQRPTKAPTPEGGSVNSELKGRPPVINWPK